MAIKNIVVNKKRDRFEIPVEVKKKYPGQHFVWIHYSPPTFDKVVRKEGEGYTLVRPPQEYKDKFKGTMIGDADVIRRGDQVLMMCPKQMFINREEEREETLVAMSQYAKQDKQSQIDKSKKGIKMEQDAVDTTEENVRLDSETLEDMKRNSK